MPPSIPTSLNFGRDPAHPGDSSSGSASNASRSFLIRWPGKLAGFLQGYLRRGDASASSNSHNEDGSNDDDSSYSHSHSHQHQQSQQRSSRKVSRADAIEADPALGITLSPLDVGLHYS